MTSARTVVGKLRRLDWNERLTLIEAMGVLFIASAVIAFLPFRTVGKLAAVRTRPPEPAQDERLLIVRRIRWAILACARRVPWRALCFEQGLTAHWMLRRRGIASVLFFGAAPHDAKGLLAHVWVRDGNVDVIGGEAAAEFAVLATFPSEEENRR